MLPRGSDLDALLLDAGNTVVFLDMNAVADVAAAHGVIVDAAILRSVEGRAKRTYEASLAEGASHESGWRAYLRTLLREAGVVDPGPLLDPLRAAHDEFNLWRRVPDDLVIALDRARAIGLRIGIVSNSEGKLPELFARVGLGDAFEIVVDSAIEGIAKPDPAIFHRAIERLDVRADRAIYAGDIPSVDVDGARNAGLHAALIDPLDFYPQHAPRFRSVFELVAALR